MKLLYLVGVGQTARAGEGGLDGPVVAFDGPALYLDRAPVAIEVPDWTGVVADDVEHFAQPSTAFQERVRAESAKRQHHDYGDDHTFRSIKCG